MVVNPEKHRHVKSKEANDFVNWIISQEGQVVVAAFKDKNGNALFIPNAK
jgi:tungstate transport system substrate-binding protein